MINNFLLPITKQKIINKNLTNSPRGELNLAYFGGTDYYKYQKLMIILLHTFWTSYL